VVNLEKMVIAEARRTSTYLGLFGYRVDAEVYGELDASDILYRDEPIRVRKRGTGYVLMMRLPFASREDMDIHRRGEELFIRVGAYKRNLILPQSLKRMTVREANFAGDHLEILFGREPRPTERS
jgi:arsenite-transporting ATPase